MAKALNALLKGVSKEPIRRHFQYQGEEVEFYSMVLTLKERDKIKKTQRDQEDGNEFALRLNEDKQRRLRLAHADINRNANRDMSRESSRELERVQTRTERDTARESLSAIP